MTPFDKSSLANRCSDSAGEDAWLIIAASCSVMMPLDCKSRTSGLWEDSFCWACVGHVKASASIRAVARHNNVFIFGNSFPDAIG
jgi:hypothetical protein